MFRGGAHDNINIMASSTTDSPTTHPSSSPTDSEILIRDFLRDNPQLDKELGDIEVMTDRYTNEEWAAQIAETQKKVKAELSAKRKYEAPQIGSKEFAETIDHTVLKLDATTKAIDDLCAEARTEGFKVRINIFFFVRSNRVFLDFGPDFG